MTNQKMHIILVGKALGDLELCILKWRYVTMKFVGFQILSVLTMKNTVLWAVMPCSLERNLYFRGTSSRSK
jgi:hypothetical protein